MTRRSVAISGWPGSIPPAQTQPAFWYVSSTARRTDSRSGVIGNQRRAKPICLAP
ncbi:hypothetical protein M8494_02795 [Serratia ureilytica]